MSTDDKVLLARHLTVMAGTEKGCFLLPDRASGGNRGQVIMARSKLLPEPKAAL